ncbi:MAG: GAF domain-containing protein [Bacteroidia bacterium]
MDPSVDALANMSNLVALIQQKLKLHWVGFYRVVRNELLLGPFNGPIACTRIEFGKGVCGTAWELGKTQIVADVDQFPGHIACSPHSKSEIVVPCVNNKGVWAVLDLDSDTYNCFDHVDQDYLEQIVALL